MIDLSLSPTQSDLVSGFREAALVEFPRDEGTHAAVHGPAPFDSDRWKRLAELGLFGLGVDEEAGGIGLGAAEELLVFIELGRVAASGPLVGTALAARVAALGQADDLLGSILSGDRRVGLIVGDHVVDALAGDLALRVTPGGAELLEIEEAKEIRSVDPLATVATVSRARTVVTVDDDRVDLRLRLLVGGYLVGIAEATTDMAVEYAKTREQFGRPIGSFQAVKHRCSEMVIRAYPARVQLSMGAVLLDSGVAGHGRLEVASGHFLAIDAGRRNAEDNVQNHGGIGFTAEHPAGVYVKRAQVYRNLAGSINDLVNEILTAPKAELG